MAENTPTPPAGGATPAGNAPTDAAAAESKQPRLSIMTQYVKDLSFENPRAPDSLGGTRGRPEISVRVDVRARNVAPDRFEITLQLNADAKSEGEAVFVAELAYSGLFQLANIPEQSLQPLLLVECPRLLFPFARRILADITRDGGFPPLMIDPIDFAALYQRRMAEQAKAASADGPAQPQAPASPAPDGGEVKA